MDRNKFDKLDNVLESYTNGNLRQMVDQMDEYGMYDFFSDFRKYLVNECEIENWFDYFSGIVIGYHRIKNR